MVFLGKQTRYYHLESSRQLRVDESGGYFAVRGRKKKRLYGAS